MLGGPRVRVEQRVVNKDAMAEQQLGSEPPNKRAKIDPFQASDPTGECSQPLPPLPASCGPCEGRGRPSGAERQPPAARTSPGPGRPSSPGRPPSPWPARPCTPTRALHGQATGGLQEASWRSPGARHWHSGLARAIPRGLQDPVFLPNSQWGLFQAGLLVFDAVCAFVGSGGALRQPQ